MLADSDAAVAAARDGAKHIGRYRELEAAGLDGTVEVEAAVTAFRRALAAGPDPAAAPAYSYNLALALQSRYDAVGEPAGDDTDFRAAIELLEHAVVAAEDAKSPYEPVLRYGLGAALRRRFQEDGDLETLRRAVGLLGDALVAGGDGSLDVADCLYEYGRGLLALADADADADADAVLDEAVRALEEVAGGVDPASPDRSAYLDAAGSARLLRYDRLGRDEDLAAALAAAREAVELQRAAGRPTAAALANLAGALVTQGHPGGCGRAGPCGSGGAGPGGARDRGRPGRRLCRGAGPGSSRRDPHQPRRRPAGPLGAQRRPRPAGRGGRAGQDAVRESTPGSIPLALRAHQLAVARRSRYLRTDDAADLEAAAAAHQQALAVQVLPVERAILLDSWANTLRTRFDRSADVADLTAAIAAYDEALAVPGGSAADRGARQNNLGGALAALAQTTGEVGAADRARAVLTEAVASTAADSLDMPAPW